MSTTLAACVKITCTDGTIFGLTTLDQDITVSGVIYKSLPGYTPTVIDESNGPSVSNFDFNGLLTTTTVFNKTDVLNGKFNGAKIYAFEYDYVALAVSATDIFNGYLGNIEIQDNQFKCEARSLHQILKNDLTQKYSPTCRAEFADAQCKAVAATYTDAGTVTAVTDRQSFTASGLAGQPVGYYTYGVITWLTGLNAGRKIGVSNFNAGLFKQFVEVYKNIQVGDTFSVVAGCDKLAATCKTKFSNKINFRGEDMLPGPDKMLG